ncbi:acyl-CoA dehydrogenase family protein [Deferribacter abyssi]|uniref:acyl-CoA dehydrogenase family protein n=1 Tax=Deferribacter abyssi TaxID=213806 RepID=UPI003C248C1A
MDFTLKDEDKLVQEVAQNFAQKVLKPAAKQIDEEEKIPEHILDQLRELGFFGVCMPEELGGAGLSFLSYVLIIKEISKACASTGVMLAVHNSLTCASINKFGTKKQKEYFLKKLISGEKIGCFMLTEPEAGSDAANISTKVEKINDKYIINGGKIFVTNGGYKGYGVLFATHDKSMRHKGISAFIVDLTENGVNIVRNEKKMGLHGSYTTVISFNNLELSKENLLGEEKNGWPIAMFLLDASRITIAAQALGIAEGAFEEALLYSNTRKQFGKKICEFEAIKFKLADMALRIEASKHLICHAAWLEDSGKTPIKEASMAKIFASETANFVTKEAIQIFGGYGYIKDYGIERYFRDAKVTEIYEGTSEIQRLVIAKELLKNLSTS